MWDQSTQNIRNIPSKAFKENRHGLDSSECEYRVDIVIFDPRV